jgi:hypothetical protein
MKYKSSRAFRQALEDRLRKDYPRHQIPRIRKMIAFERLMARLGEHWILKGGYALQLRIENARTTQDIDLLAQRFINPILVGMCDGKWDPASWEWKRD